MSSRSALRNLLIAAFCLSLFAVAIAVFRRGPAQDSLRFNPFRPGSSQQPDAVPLPRPSDPDGPRVKGTDEDGNKKEKTADPDDDQE